MDDIDHMSLDELFVFSVHDFLLGDKEMASPNSPSSALDQVRTHTFPNIFLRNLYQKFSTILL